MKHNKKTLAKYLIYISNRDNSSRRAVEEVLRVLAEKQGDKEST